MTVARLLTLLSLALSALADHPHGEGHVSHGGQPGKRQAVTGREANKSCYEPKWVPACQGVFACVPPGAVCCSDGITYAMPPDTCQGGTEDTTGAAGVRADAEPNPDVHATSEQNHNDEEGGGGKKKPNMMCCRPNPVTTPPHPAATQDAPDHLTGNNGDDDDNDANGPHGGPGLAGGLGGPGLGEIVPPGPDHQSVSHFGQHWFTFSITWHYWSYFYSHAGGPGGGESTTAAGPLVLGSTPVLCTTEVAVRASDAARASEYFASISASVVLSTPVQTETPVVTAWTHWASSEPSQPTEAATPVEHGVGNGTVVVTIGAPSAVVTAGAASLGGFARAVVAGLCGLVFGVAVAML
ncbi:hypothetical protein VTK26DRAFT_179 [Humicola hyalothermophila]